MDPGTVRANQKLLVGGVWCICDIEYFHTDDSRVSPWILGSLKPIQLSLRLRIVCGRAVELLKRGGADLLLQSIGFNPEMFGRRGS